VLGKWLGTTLALPAATLAVLLVLAGPAPAQATAPTPDAATAATAAAAAASPDVSVAAIDGVVGDEQDNALGGVCVVFYLQGNWDGAVVTSGDGSFSFTAAAPGDQQLAVFRPSVPGDCDSAPLATGPVPEWYSDVPLAFTDAHATVPDANAALVADTSNSLKICLGERELYTGSCAPRQGKVTGPGVISGRVVQAGDTPLAQACVFVLPQAADSDGYPAITDTDGRYRVTGLPIGNYVVGVIPPFDVGQGPCRFDNGPPPVPAAGALQPEWYGNAWVDLAVAGNVQDIYPFALAAGATSVAPDAAGIDVCITNDPATVTPRPPCSTVAAESTTAGPALAFTGPRDQTVPIAVGLGALLVGLALVAAARRGRPTPRPGT
jgi:hypothetical protein